MHTDTVMRIEECRESGKCWVLGRWVARLYRETGGLVGRWVGKLEARLLATAALWFKSRHLQKNKMVT
jgi:hypothetical protein